MPPQMQARTSPYYSRGPRWRRRWTRTFPLSPLLTLSDQAALALQSWPEFIMTFVREGESLKAVAERFNTTVTALAAVNALANPDAPAEGEALLVPVGFRIR